MTLGERIVFYRRRQNLTQKALADLMGISPTRLNYWEKDKREPDVRMINQLCRVLEVDPKFLLSDVEASEEGTLPTLLRIKEARMKAGLTQQQLSDKLGVAVTTLNGYETGRSDPKTEYLIPISQICGVTVDFLLGMEEEGMVSSPQEVSRTKISTTADRLKEIINRRNLKQVDILELAKPYCDMYGVKLGKNDLSQYVNGHTEPRQDKLTILGLALGVSEPWLMGYDVPPGRKQKTPPSPAEPDRRERGRVEVSAEALERMLQREGFIQPGENLSDADLRFLFGVGEVISAWFGKGQQGGRK